MGHATLDGIPVSTQHGSTVMSLRYGYEPATVNLTIPIRAAAALRPKLGQAVKLVHSGRGVEQAMTVYPLLIGPGTSLRNRRVLIADRRWLWQYRMVIMSFNMRRRSAQTRLDLGKNQRVEIGQIVGDIIYLDASLNPKNGEKWKPEEILKTVIELVDPEANLVSIPDLPDGLHIENLDLLDSGPEALARTLGFAPGLRLRINYDDSIEIVRYAGGAEAEQAKAMRFYVGGGHVARVDRSAIRPANIHVGFEAELEVKWEHTGTASGFPVKSTVEPLEVINVMRVPEIVIKYQNKVYVRNSWIPIATYMAWAASKWRKAPKLTWDNLHEHFASGFAVAEWANTPDDDGAPDNVITRRFKALRKYFRQSFMLMKPWRDRFFSFEANRLATAGGLYDDGSELDYENAVRAKSEVYCDWIQKPTIRGYKRWLGGKVPLGFAIKGYFATVAGADSAPIDVEIEDEQAGVFRIRGTADYWGMREGIIFGAPIGEAKETFPALQDMIFAASLNPLTWTGTPLKREWKMSVILSHRIAKPNSARRMWWQTITPEEASKTLGYDLGDCNGPDYYINVGSAGGWWAARFEWNDDRAQTIQHFIAGQATSTLPEIYPDGPLNKDHISVLAQAAAASVYESFSDRYEGAAYQPFKPGANPVGSLTGTHHVVDNQGHTRTLMQFEPMRFPRPTWDLLDPSVRSQLLRQVQQ